jgi:hypothetical protein
MRRRAVHTKGQMQSAISRFELYFGGQITLALRIKFYL